MVLERSQRLFVEYRQGLEELTRHSQERQDG